MKSKIFTKAEQESLKKRMEGSKEDKTGIFSARVKPKIIEILGVWIPKKKELDRLIR